MVVKVLGKDSMSQNVSQNIKQDSNSAALIIFIDGLGWQALQEHPWFLAELAPHRKGLKTILGYSSACDPSILTGKRPQEHGLWSSYFFSPATSPFKWLSFLNYLPRWVYDNKVGNSWRVRTKLSKVVAKIACLKGYFELYSIPLCRLPDFDYAEKVPLWAPCGVPDSDSVFDLIRREKKPFYAQFGTPEAKQMKEIKQLLESGESGIYFLQLGKVDALLHKEGPHSSALHALLQEYQQQIVDLITAAQGPHVRLLLFSDHGMREVIASHQLTMSELAMPARSFFLDSTMARIWCQDEKEKEAILKYLSTLSYGSILTEAALKEFGIYFPDGKYGDLIFLLKPGHVFAPSYMGAKAPKGMHGYTPCDAYSDAMLMADEPIAKGCQEIQDIYHIIKKIVEETPAQ